MRSPVLPPRRPSHLIRYVIPAVVLLCILYYLSCSASDGRPYVHNDHGSNLDFSTSLQGEPQAFDEKNPSLGDVGEMPTHEPEPEPSQPEPIQPIEQIQASYNDTPPHPIDTLMRVADREFNAMMEKQTTTVAEAAAAYRKRRGRHPPPGFDKWFQFAKTLNSVIVEDFFDQIYEDLNPFWGVDPQRIRKEAWDFEMTISIRDGHATAGSDWFWTKIWLDMIQTIEHLLPDMDIALNAMDEPRLVVPWEDINGYMQKEKATRNLPDPLKVESEYQTLPDPSKGETLPKTRHKNWEKKEPYWAIVRRGCPPDSAARTSSILEYHDQNPIFTASNAIPHQYKGYVSNYTLSTDICHQPDLQGLEGIFIKPQSISSTKVLFPLFGGSKLGINNEILLPAPMYWNGEERFTGGGFYGPSWDQKVDVVTWRGVATGGRNTAKNWRGFQRHRFVSMNNATKVTRAETKIEPPINFVLPSGPYEPEAQKEGKLGSWINTWADVGATDLMCDPHNDPQGEDGHCPYTDPYFDVIEGRPMADQFHVKYLPDIDGNSFSGRYLAFLRSTSVPIKSTVFREWHDSRLVAWKHFVPMDNRFGDYYNIMEYFLGYGDKLPAHDESAKKIAMAGQAWAEKVLRKEDMQIYVLRLLLEYARVSDERREIMGWVDDLLARKSRRDTVEAKFARGKGKRR